MCFQDEFGELAKATKNETKTKTEQHRIHVTQGVTDATVCMFQLATVVGTTLSKRTRPSGSRIHPHNLQEHQQRHQHEPQ